MLKREASIAFASAVLLVLAQPLHGRAAQKGNVLPGIDVCGKFITDRLVGGNITTITEYPWMALIERKDINNVKVHHCGGSLINSRYVMTAGHCVKSKDAAAPWEITSVRLGEWNVETMCDCGFDVRCVDCEKKSCQRCGCECAPPHQDVPVEKTIAHPEYVANSQDQYHDIALLRLARSVEYTEFVKPICLPMTQELRNRNFMNRKLLVAGWGVTETMAPSPVKLQIEISSFNFNECRKIYRPRHKLINENYQLCAGGESGIDACGGDSGGPLIVSERFANRDIYFAAGIVSFGPEPCGIENWPGVYARVGNYMSWIMSTLEP